MDAGMKRNAVRWICAVGALVAGMSVALADFEVTAPDGRRILLKDDKTWAYVEKPAPKPAKAAEAKAGEKTTDAKDVKDDKAGNDEKVAEKKDEGEAILSLVGKMPGNRICRFQLRLVNNLPYEIRSLVPEFSVYRANNVVYDSVFSGFAFLKPGDSQQREVRFNGIACEEITRIQVGGGDRCEMGELDKFSSVRGQCLSRVRVVGSDIVRFDK